jgi:hypothetical protein
VQASDAGMPGASMPSGRRRLKSGKTGNRGGGKARCSWRYEGLASAGGASRFDRAARKSSWDAIVDRLVVSIFKKRSVLGGSVGPRRAAARPARNAW